MSTHTTAPLKDFAVIVDARDNVAVAKTEIPPGLDRRARRHGRSRSTGTVTPGNRFALARSPRRVRAPIRAADRHVARDRRRRPDLAREHVERRAGRTRPRSGPDHSAARLPRRLGARHLHGLPPRRRSDGHAQLHPDRPDQHVREPRGDADRDDQPNTRSSRAKNIRRSTASSPSRTTRGCGCSDGSTST